MKMACYKQGLYTSSFLQQLAFTQVFLPEDDGCSFDSGSTPSYLAWTTSTKGTSPDYRSPSAAVKDWMPGTCSSCAGFKRQHSLGCDSQKQAH